MDPGPRPNGTKWAGTRAQWDQMGRDPGPMGTCVPKMMAVYTWWLPGPMLYYKYIYIYIYIYDFIKVTPYHKPLPRETLANSELYVLPAYREDTGRIPEGYRKDTGRRQVTRQASLGIHSESTRHVLGNSGKMSGKHPHCALHVRVHISGLWLPPQT